MKNEEDEHEDEDHNYAPTWMALLCGNKRIPLEDILKDIKKTSEHEYDQILLVAGEEIPGGMKKIEGYILQYRENEKIAGLHSEDQDVRYVRESLLGALQNPQSQSQFTNFSIVSRFPIEEGLWLQEIGGGIAVHTKDGDFINKIIILEKD